MAKLTGLFQRGSSYYLQVVLPQDHPLRTKYKNGKYVVSLAGCGNTDRKKWGIAPQQRVVESEFHHLEI